jgi:peptidoglycan/LPS O-acetylase OafA/YrhL
MISPARRRGFFDRFATMDQGACATSLWRNFTFTNNMVDFAGCWNITWSLCVQMQFYAAFPLALLALQPQKPGFRWACDCQDP